MDIRNRFLSHDDAEWVYQSHPHLRGKKYTEFCPTCGKANECTFKWRGEKVKCDCELQLALHKWYLASGIGMTYQRLGWSDVESDSLIEEVAEFVTNPEYIRRGMGLFLTGDYGTGKTLAANLALKDFVREGLSCFAITFAQMVDMYTAGWHSASERANFHSKILHARVLLIDDLGRELRTKNQLSETTFDNVMRTRVQHGRSTIITTNMDPVELGEGYGGAVLSLLREKSLAIAVGGDDYRNRARERELDEIKRGEVRPIQ